MTFRVGQKVARINVVSNRFNVAGPAAGEVCTVENIIKTHDGGLMLELVEYPSPGSDLFYAGFNAECFRPIVERSTDISILTALLNPENHREMVDHDQR